MYFIRCMKIQSVSYMVIAEKPRFDTQARSAGNPADFFRRIGREDLKGTLTAKTPWMGVTAEVYRPDIGLTANGGLGALTRDIDKVAGNLGIPLVTFAPFYPIRLHQRLDGDFRQVEYQERLNPEEFGWRRVANALVRANGDVIPVAILEHPKTGVKAVYEPGLKDVYHGPKDCDHRLYQQAILGFGANLGAEELGLRPPIRQIHEASAALALVGYIDNLVSKGMSWSKALERARETHLHSNHTLVQAVNADYTADQIRHYVVPNIKNYQTRDWLEGLLGRSGRLNFSTVALDLSGQFNGVSKLHAKIASSQFTRSDGSLVEFAGLTNGIDPSWVASDFLAFYQAAGAIDSFFLPASDAKEKLESIDPEFLRAEKTLQRLDLIDYLHTRIDQHGQEIDIPNDAIIACWSKRLAGYKRPGMIFENPQLLGQMLEKSNIHMLLSGKAHSEDDPMKYELQRIMGIVEQNPDLKRRVHFVQDYDDQLAERLVKGADICFNTPIIGEEACATFWMKCLANLAVLVSTHDGGVADVTEDSYLNVSGGDYKQQLKSLYQQFAKAAHLVRGSNDEWEEQVVKQLGAYLPIISGSRMWADHINLVFPKKIT